MKGVLIAIAVLALVGGIVIAGDESCSASAEKTGQIAHKCKASAQDCLNGMAAQFRDRGWVGIELDMNEETGVMSVTKVEPRSPAYDAGFTEGDVLVALNGVRLDEANKEKVYAAKEKMTAGTTVTYTVARDGQKKDLDVTLGQIPEAVLAKWIGRHMIEGHTADEHRLARVPNISGARGNRIETGIRTSRRPCRRSPPKLLTCVLDPDFLRSKNMLSKNLTELEDVRITSKGQVTIPQEIREKLGLLPHTEVVFEIDGTAVRGASSHRADAGAGRCPDVHR